MSNLPTNQIKIFSNPNLGEVRVNVTTNNEPLFCLADLCSALGIVNHRNVRARLDDDDVRQMDATDNLGRTQQTTFVTEAGMYDVILRSDAPTAKPFRKWVTSEVLPSIRKSGSYSLETDKRSSSRRVAGPKVSDRIRAAKFLASFLNLNESSKLLLAKSIADPLGLPTPDYTPSKGILRSCAELLKEHASTLSPQQFNQRMIQHKYMVELTRPSSKGGVKKFKSIVADGLQYGENQVNPNNPKSTQPLYYADKFGELLTLLTAN